MGGGFERGMVVGGGGGFGGCRVLRGGTVAREGGGFEVGSGFRFFLYGFLRFLLFFIFTIFPSLLLPPPALSTLSVLDS